jgi:hypothetical protein
VGRKRVTWIGMAGGAVLLLLAGLAAAAWYSFVVPGRPHEGPLPPPTAEERAMAERLRVDVTAIASVPHNVQHYEAFERAAQHIEGVLQGLGYAMDPQVFTVAGRAVRNIEATREPKTITADTQTLVLGAHYDSFEDAPGANDNGTGTAAVLELARLLKDWQPARTRVRYVLFVNEEPPYYRTPDMGSLRYVQRLVERKEKVRGMLSLETLGAFSDEPGSQTYPPPFGLFYPSTANFVAFVGLPGSRTFLHEVIEPFRKHTAFPSLGGISTDYIDGIGWSDHWSFSRQGFPAVMVTDTALFRYKHYHLPSDTPDKVDYAKLARITKGMERVVREIAP